MNYLVECIVRKQTDTRSTYTMKLVIQAKDEAELADIARREVAKEGYVLVRLGRIIENQTVSF